MPPPQQRLETGDLPGPKVDQRLIEQLEFVGTQRLMKVEFQDTTRLHPRVHLGMEQTKDATPIGLGPIQGQVGTFQQLIGFQSVLRCERYAYTDANDNLMFGDLEWLREHLDNALGEPDCVERRLNRGLQDGEFVTAQPGNRVSLPQAIRQAFGDGLQQSVADVMPERVVHRLELIEIEKVERQQPTPARISQGLFQLLVEQHPIGQVGQCVMMGEMLDFAREPAPFDHVLLEDFHRIGHGPDFITPLPVWDLDFDGTPCERRHRSREANGRPRDRSRDQQGCRNGDADADRHEQREGHAHPCQAVEQVGGGLALRCACARADASVSTRRSCAKVSSA